MRASVIVSAIGLVLITSAASAVPITFEYSGVVTSTNFATADPFGGAIAPGTAFSGFYTFDDRLLDLTTQPHVGLYLMHGPPIGAFGPPYGVRLSVGGFEVSAGDFFDIVIVNDWETVDSTLVDNYQLEADGATLAVDPAFAYTSIAINFSDLDASVFSDEELLFVPPDANEFEIRELRIRVGADGASTQVPGAPAFQGSITSLKHFSGPITRGPVFVPEPGTLLLLSTGLFGIGLLRRR